jgi:phosphohistidine phosphatase SixA
VRLYLVRHAESAPGHPDELRTLTAHGRVQAGELGARLAAAPEPPAVVLSSPLLRARETAAAIARATGANLRLDERLAPGMTLASLRAAAWASAATTAVAVAHQPDCSTVALELTGRDPGFPPAGLAELEL